MCRACRAPDDSDRMFRASKLLNSVSTSGPVATSYPIDTKIRSMSRRTSVRGCNAPRAAPGAGSVISTFSVSIFRASSASRNAASFCLECNFHPLLRLVDQLARQQASPRRQFAKLSHHLPKVALLAEHLLPNGLEGG